MNCSFCANAVPAPNKAIPPATAAINVLKRVIISSLGASFGSSKVPPVRLQGFSQSMREGTEAQLLLADGPEPRQTVGLDDQKEDDQRAEDHRLQIGHQIDRNLQPGEARRVVEKNRQQHNEGGAEERAQDAAEAPQHDNEQHLERQP